MHQFRLQVFQGLVGKYISRHRSATLDRCPFVRRRSSHKAIKSKQFDVPDKVRLGSVDVHLPQSLPGLLWCRLYSSRKNNKCSRIKCSHCGWHYHPLFCRLSSALTVQETRSQEKHAKEFYCIPYISAWRWLVACQSYNVQVRDWYFKHLVTPTINNMAVQCSVSVICWMPSSILICLS